MDHQTLLEWNIYKNRHAAKFKVWEHKAISNLSFPHRKGIIALLSAKIPRFVAFLPLNYLGHMRWPWVILKNTSFVSVYALDVCLYKQAVWNSLAMSTDHIDASKLANCLRSPCNRDLWPAALFLAVKVPPVIGPRNQCSTWGTDWRERWQVLYPSCHKPLASAAELHCCIQWEVLWEPSLDHSFSIAVLISAHQHIKDC